VIAEKAALAASFIALSWFLPRPGLAQETLTVFAPDCSTPQTTFTLGDTVCARVSNVAPVNFDSIRFQWVPPSLGVAQDGPNITTDPQFTSFSIPTSGPLAQTGTWYVGTVDNGNGAGRVQANFTVSALAALGVTKAFAPTSIAPGGVSVLTVTLTNPNPTPITGVAFVDTIPTNLQIALAPVAATTCPAGVVGGTPSTLTFSGGTVPASASCEVSMAVTGTVPATYVNVIPIGGVTTANAGSSVAAAVADLVVAPLIIAVPTLSAWALAVLAGALGLLALLALRRG
jgi:uncharacterized repeat protein (TIGR01451 family)